MRKRNLKHSEQLDIRKRGNRENKIKNWPFLIDFQTHKFHCVLSIVYNWKCHVCVNLLNIGRNFFFWILLVQYDKNESFVHFHIYIKPCWLMYGHHTMRPKSSMKFYDLARGFNLGIYRIGFCLCWILIFFAKKNKIFSSRTLQTLHCKVELFRTEVEEKWEREPKRRIQSSVQSIPNKSEQRINIV